MLHEDPDRLLLQLRIENYKRARDASAASERRGCDVLIEEAESRLRALTSRPAPAPPEPSDVARDGER